MTGCNIPNRHLGIFLFPYLILVNRLSRHGVASSKSHRWSTYDEQAGRLVVDLTLEVCKVAYLKNNLLIGEMACNVFWSFTSDPP